MLATLSDVKTYLGVSVNTYDTFLTQQIGLISEAIEGYCGRKFEVASYTQTFYAEDYEVNKKEVLLFHYPVTAVTQVKDGDEIITDYRLHFPTGYLTKTNGLFNADTLEVKYSAGYSTIPSTVLHVLYSLVETNYNKKVNGIALSFGSDVQSISIPGVINVQFDYTLESNQRKTSYGTILGSFANVLDNYRSERVITGSGKIAYVG